MTSITLPQAFGAGLVAGLKRRRPARHHRDGDDFAEVMALARAEEARQLAEIEALARPGRRKGPPPLSGDLGERLAWIDQEFQVFESGAREPGMAVLPGYRSELEGYLGGEYDALVYDLLDRLAVLEERFPEPDWY
jgi:hypothetical protein